MTKVEPMVEPDCILNDFRWEAISLVHRFTRFHGRILTDWELTCQHPIADCQLLLPDGSLVLTRTQIVGTVYDEAKDISYVRCKYLGLNQYDEKSLELLISERVDELDHAKLVGLM